MHLASYSGRCRIKYCGGFPGSDPGLTLWLMDEARQGGSLPLPPYRFVRQARRVTPKRVPPPKPQPPRSFTWGCLMSGLGTGVKMKMP